MRDLERSSRRPKERPKRSVCLSANLQRKNHRKKTIPELLCQSTVWVKCRDRNQRSQPIRGWQGWVPSYNCLLLVTTPCFLIHLSCVMSLPIHTWFNDQELLLVCWLFSFNVWCVYTFSQEWVRASLFQFQSTESIHSMEDMFEQC